MKVLKWIVIILGVLLIGMFIFYKIAQSNTKKHSPEQTIAFTKGDLKIEVFYCRPFKKNRQIFDSLVPYGVTWRTGANEPTTFTTNKELSILGMPLPVGHYSFWTVPNADEWEVIWNKKEYGWGVSFDGQASRDPDHDALKVSVPAESRSEVLEQFTISFSEDEQLNMKLEWDKTVVTVPISY